MRVPLDEEAVGKLSRGVELLALDDALGLLSQIDSRKGRVVEWRYYFGGLSVEESAEVLGISPETVKRDWKLAKAWGINQSYCFQGTDRRQPQLRSDTFDLKQIS